MNDQNQHLSANCSANCAADLGLFLIRAVLTTVFIYHGSQKLFGWFDGPGIQGTAGFMDKLGVPLPLAAAYVVGCTEFFGGIVMLLGTGARIAAIPMTINMIVAITLVHSKAFSTQHMGMEFPLTLAVVLASIGLIGPGRFTVCRLFCARKTCTTPQPAPPPAT